MISSLFSLAAASLIGDTGLALAGIGIGVGLVVIGAGKSIGNIAGKAVESIARQPEAGGRRKWKDALDRPFSVGASTDDQAPLVVADCPGHDFTGTGTVAVG